MILILVLLKCVSGNKQPERNVNIPFLLALKTVKDSHQKVLCETPITIRLVPCDYQMVLLLEMPILNIVLIKAMKLETQLFSEPRSTSGQRDEKVSNQRVTTHPHRGSFSNWV